MMTLQTGDPVVVGESVTKRWIRPWMPEKQWKHHPERFDLRKRFGRLDWILAGRIHVYHVVDQKLTGDVGT